MDKDEAMEIEMDMKMEEMRKEQLEAFHEVGQQMDMNESKPTDQGDDGDFLGRTCV